MGIILHINKHFYEIIFLHCRSNIMYLEYLPSDALMWSSLSPYGIEKSSVVEQQLNHILFSNQLQY